MDTSNAFASSSVFQSAPGIADGRCFLTLEIAHKSQAFQSAPGIAAGRCLPFFETKRTTDMVSIRARHCCRAMPNPRGFGPTTHCFNPRPALLPGDALWDQWLRHGHAVSIRARHCCRAMRPPLINARIASAFQSAPGIAAGRCLLPLCGKHLQWCFNPRPALLPGDAQLNDLYQVIRTVSIRARHCCRAMHGLSVNAPGAHWFQSAPGIAAGRCPVGGGI